MQQRLEKNAMQFMCSKGRRNKGSSEKGEEAREAGRKKEKEEGRGGEGRAAAEAGFAAATGKIMMLSKMNLFHFHVKANFVRPVSVSVDPSPPLHLLLDKIAKLQTKAKRHAEQSNGYGKRGTTGSCSRHTGLD